MKCDHCNKEIETKPDKRGSVRLPSGWKRFLDSVWCKGCWSARYVLRAVTFPLSGPVPPVEWKSFGPMLDRAWAESTAAANWYVTELAKADVVRMPAMEKCPAAPRDYLYPKARLRFPALSPSSLVAIEHSVRNRYNRSRIDTIWRSNKSLQRFRYPFPYTVPAQAWSGRWLNDDRVPIVSLLLGGERIELKLGTKQGRFRRHLAAFESFLNGEALPGTMEIYRQRASSGDQRHTDTERTVYTQTMVKLCMWLPKSDKPGDVTMKVCTGADCFIRASLCGKDDWIVQADHVWRWIAEYNSRRFNLDTDRKWEKRWPKEKRRQMNESMRVWADKHQRRLATWVHECTAHLIGYATRNKVGRIEYDDAVHQFGDDVNFPWHSIKTTLAQKCEANNIEFASTEMAQNAIETARESTTV